MDAAFLFATKGGIREMAVFRVEKNSGYTVMSNHHLRNRALSLKAKGLLSYNKIVVFIDRSPAECYNSFRVLWIGEALLV